MLKPLCMTVVPCTEHAHLSWKCGKCKAIYYMQWCISVEQLKATPFVACVKN
jgi:hypothetical protein